MKYRSVLVTGASGFIGRILVKRLAESGIKVKAGVHNPTNKRKFTQIKGVDPVILDVLDKKTLSEAMQNIDALYHFAALVDAKASADDLFKINGEGTRNVWECAAQAGIKKALYCSTTAVYGLLAQSKQPISEKIIPKAIEPYGRSKYIGELAAIEIAEKYNMETVIIRPVAVFGPNQNTTFGKNLLNAAFSKLLLPGGFEKKKFNFIHVEDLVEASIHLMNIPGSDKQVYNLAVDRTISFEEAFNAYHQALKQSDQPTFRLKLIATLSGLLHKSPLFTSWISRFGSKGLSFNIWHPGFDLTFSSEKLLKTSFAFKWRAFDEVLLSCIIK